MKGSSKTEIITNDAGEMAGVVMQGDFVSEHEWGIEKLKEILGVNTTKLGIKGRKLGINGRTVTNTEHLRLFKGKNHDYLYAGFSYDNDESRILKYLENNGEINRFSQKEKNIESGWSEEKFCIVAKDKDTKDFIAEIYKLAQKKELCIWLGKFGNNPFSRGGLVIVIKSRIEQDIKQQMLDDDKAAIALRKASEKTKIPNRMKSSDYRMWTANPHWTTSKEVERTKHKVIYWLTNHMNVWGYFTVEEINEWLDKNTGKIPEAINDAMAKKK